MERQLNQAVYELDKSRDSHVRKIEELESENAALKAQIHDLNNEVQKLMLQVERLTR